MPRITYLEYIEIFDPCACGCCMPVMRPKKYRPHHQLKTIGTKKTRRASEAQRIARKIGEKPNTTLQREQYLLLQQNTIELVAEGMALEDIAVKLDQPLKTIQDAAKHATARLTQHYASATPQRNFIAYTIFHRKLIKQLDSFADKFVGAKQYTAAVTAIRAQSDMLDKIYSKGKELGVLQTQPMSRQRAYDKTELLKSLKDEYRALAGLITDIESDEYTITLERIRATAKAKTKRQAEKKLIETEFALPKIDWSKQQEEEEDA